MSTRKRLPSWLTRAPAHLSRPLRYVTFGEIVARKRKELKMSQQVMAEKVGISRNYLSFIERDLASNLSVAILIRLARGLNLDKCKLLNSYAANLVERDAITDGRAV